MPTAVLVLALILASAASALAGAQELQQDSGLSGNSLQEFCRSEHDIGVAFCLGFAAAVAGVVSRQEFQGRRACPYR